ncbi:hypothetical protein Emag_004866 [Eimeria magna]
MIVLCWFLHHNDYNGFRIEELEALATLEGVEPASLWDGCKRPPSESEEQFVFVNIPTEDFCFKVMQRSLLIKAFVDVWAEGETYEEVVKELQIHKIELIRKWVNSERTWAFKFGAFGKSLSSEVQKQKMSFFAPLFKGDEKVDLSHPDTTLTVAEQWTHQKHVEAPVRIYFGRQIVHKSKDLPFWWRYRLPVRPVLGPTSLDCELAFVMCNQGLVEANHVVLDPFVGTGGLLIAAAHYGDSMPEENVHDEHRRAAYLRRRLAGGKPWVDCIMTDPPYGIRAGARQSGHTKRCKRNEQTRSNEEKQRERGIVWVLAAESQGKAEVLNTNAEGAYSSFPLWCGVCSSPDALDSLSHEDLDLVATSLQQLSGAICIVQYINQQGYEEVPV